MYIAPSAFATIFKALITKYLQNTLRTKRAVKGRILLYVDESMTFEKVVQDLEKALEERTSK